MPRVFRLFTFQVNVNAPLPLWWQPALDGLDSANLSFSNPLLLSNHLLVWEERGPSVE